MTTKSRTVSLDDVLADYAREAREFDAQVLQRYISQYPDYALALQRYAQVQLSSAPATPEAIDAEATPDEEMLPQQSQLLRRMQHLRQGPSAADVDVDVDVEEATKRLDGIVGRQATEAAAAAVFDSVEHGEDDLFLCIVEHPGAVDVPDWVHGRLGRHLRVPPAALVAAMAKRRPAPRAQRHSAAGRLSEAEPIPWRQAVLNCITDAEVQNELLSR
jgi:hypothetical protein